MNVGHSLITTIKRLLLSILLRCSYQISVMLEEYTYVPVPPSKCRTDAAYDDRMTEILRIAQTYEPWLDYRELVVQNVSTIASHTATNRPSPEAIMANYQLNEQLLEGCRPWIVIFDDVF